MRRYLVLILLIILIVALAIIFQGQSAYVLVSTSHWAMQTSLWFAIILLLILFVMFYVLVRILLHANSLSKKCCNWFKKKSAL